MYASQYDEIVNEQLYAGKVQLEASLLELVNQAENVLDLDEKRRKRTILRVDGGGGTDKIIDKLLLHHYWLLMKVKNWQRTQKSVKSVTVWHNLPDLPSHEVGWVEAPHAYEKTTRQLAVRWFNNKKWQYGVLVFNLTDLMIVPLAGWLMPRKPTEQEVFSAILKAYNLRTGSVETSIKNSKQGLGLNKQNKKRFDAQHLLLLLAQLAYNIAVWARNKLAKHSTAMAKFGMARLMRDVFRISGKVLFDEKGIVHLIILNQAHTLASTVLKTWQSCFARDDLSLILGKI